MPTEKFKKSKKVKFVTFKKKDGSLVKFKAKRKSKGKHNFPKNARKGDQKTIRVKRKGQTHGRYVTFEATGKKQPKWKIVKNVPAY